MWRVVSKDYTFVTIEKLHEILVSEDDLGSSSYLRFHYKSANESIQLNHIAVGKAIDNFLIPRPWWRIVDLEQTNYVSLVRADSSILPTLQVISLSQNPPDCSLVPLRYHETPIDSYGNTAYDVTNNKLILFWAIHGPYVLPKGNKYFPAFINVDEACPLMNISNAFECLFLPFTNCTEALNALSVSPTTPKSIIYSNATSAGIPISKEEAETIIERNHVNKRSIFNEVKKEFSYHRYSETFITGKTIVSVHEISKDYFFTYGYLFRMNYLFRQHVADDLKRFFIHHNYQFQDGRHNSLQPQPSTHHDGKLLKTASIKAGKYTLFSFPNDGDCVAIHIRRSFDRQIPGVDMNEWCRKFKYHPKEGSSCQYYNFTSDSYANVRCAYFDDMGCNMAMPYGAISLEEYINASQVLSNTTINLYIRTDNPKWLYHQLEKLNDYYKKRYHFYIFTTYENHRTLIKYYSDVKQDSDFLHITNNDIKHSSSYFAAIEIARKCNRGFVGHSGSAVTGFWLNSLCAYHAGVFGKCPPFFDFAITSGPKSWNINLTSGIL